MVELAIRGGVGTTTDMLRTKLMDLHQNMIHHYKWSLILLIIYLSLVFW